MKIKQLKLSTKLWLGFMSMVIFALVSSGLISYYHTYASLKEHGTQTLSNAVLMAKKVLEIQNNDYLDGEISLESAQRDAMKFLSESAGIDLGDHGYFVVSDTNGYIFVHPSIANTGGIDLMDQSDDPKFFLREAIEKAKKGGGFVSFTWTYPDSDVKGEKIMYASYFEPWDWVIMATAYTDDYKTSAMAHFSDMMFPLILVVLLVYFVVRLFMDAIFKPVNETVSAMRKIESGEYVQLDKGYFEDDLSTLINGYNHMVNAIKESQEALLTRNRDLEEANAEIQALYEEMLASDELLQYNYDELEKYKIALEHEKDNYRKILIASNEAYWQYDFDNEVITFSNLSKDIKAQSIALSMFLNRVYEDDLDLIKHYFDRFSAVQSKLIEVKFRMLIQPDDVTYHWFQLLGIHEGDALFGSLTDIHHDIVNKERIEFYAFHDPVLGLYNMDFLNDVVAHAIIDSEENEAHVLLVIGVVGYDRIVNAYGKNLADIMTFQLSAEINTVFKDAQYISVLHSGRFAVWMNCEDKNHCSAERLDALEDALSDHVGRFSNIEMPVNIAYGATLVDQSKKDSANAISEAETAFEFAASRGIYKEIQWYDDSLKVQKERLLAIEQHLIKAIDRRELYLVYQPQFGASSRQDICGYEALIRWRSDELGFVPPNEFIPLAESIDFINLIGRFVIEEATDFMQRQSHLGNRVYVSINASYKELLQTDYVSYLLETLKKKDLDISQLHIEITETTISEYLDVVIESLNALIHHGFKVHMDDFGTGYSSLYQLGKMPIQVLKIDKSFVWALENDLKMRALTKLIIDVAHRMEMKIIAEGVETEVQYQILLDMSCDYFQGYLLSKPLQESEIIS